MLLRRFERQVVESDANGEERIRWTGIFKGNVMSWDLPEGKTRDELAEVLIWFSDFLRELNTGGSGSTIPEEDSAAYWFKVTPATEMHLAQAERLRRIYESLGQTTRVIEKDLSGSPLSLRRRDFILREDAYQVMLLGGRGARRRAYGYHVRQRAVEVTANAVGTVFQESLAVLCRMFPRLCPGLADDDW